MITRSYVMFHFIVGLAAIVYLWDNLINPK
jgi:hypothetical protein